MSDYTFRKLENNEFEILIPLMKNCFGMNVNLQYFKWKYLDNPAGEFIGFIAISPANEVAAYYGVIPELYSIEGTEKIIFQSCDTMTHSSHRRKGLFEKLAKMCYSYLQENNKLFIIGFGGAKSTPGLLKFGWVYSFSMFHYFFPRIFSHFLNLTFQLRSNKNFIIRNAEVNEIKELLQESNSSGTIHSIRSELIFKWRISNPRYQYKLIGCFDNNKEATGYTCYYITDGKMLLFDYAFKTKKAGNVLCKELKKIILKQDLKGIVAFCQEKSDYSKTLKRLGFINNPFNKGPLSERTPFVFLADKENLTKYNDQAKWLINSFDHDAL